MFACFFRMGCGKTNRINQETDFIHVLQDNFSDCNNCHFRHSLILKHLRELRKDSHQEFHNEKILRNTKSFSVIWQVDIGDNFWVLVTQLLWYFWMLIPDPNVKNRGYWWPKPSTTSESCRLHIMSPTSKRIPVLFQGNVSTALILWRK